MTVNTTPPRRYWLLTSPRTASNMLVKILNLEAQAIRPVFQGGYFFLQSTALRFPFHTKPMRDWTPDERAAVDTAQLEAFTKFQDHIAASEHDNQTIFVKEHAVMLSHPLFESQHAFGPDAGLSSDQPTPLPAHGVDSPTRSPLNLTSLPDEFLKTWYPTFLIRHPALVIPSLYRSRANQASVDSDQVPQLPLLPETTMKWTRSLYEFYRAHFASSPPPEGEENRWPIVLDADDIMTSPALVQKYASLTGLDPERLRFNWQKASAEEMEKLNPMHRAMVGSIMGSEKVDLSKVAGEELDIAAEAEKWRVEFGEEVGRRMEGEVRGMMGDYEVLRAARLRVD
ncbi:uncharacterized protein C8A04DRAFT_14036 [Dichotomopilus funicola]|uniref:Sulfotransferase n=1 Tax=Dichotomopilus funicola TaxID=1934379 RepID=A0AAN6UZD9_9PEZI|nr:hypothetical protein C8A04DRAFT_14036 [Dichotomopilus funicola]